MPDADPDPSPVVVVGGGIAGLAAATGLAERGVPVVLIERETTLGGRVRSWPVTTERGDALTMSRGFHAFFRQYYNLRSLLRRADPALERLVPVDDYPLTLADGPTDSFARIPRTPPLSIAAFVARSPSFPVRALRHVDVGAALGLLDVRFPQTYADYDGVSAADVLDRLRFPDEARHLALEVFARSFFADPRDFSGGELVAMFHTYFTGSAEGLLFDVPADDYDARAVGAPRRPPGHPRGRRAHGRGGRCPGGRAGRHTGASRRRHRRVGERHRARDRPRRPCSGSSPAPTGSATPCGAGPSPSSASRRPSPCGASGSIDLRHRAARSSSARAATVRSTT